MTGSGVAACDAARLKCAGQSGAERLLSLLNAWVEPLVLALEVGTPVLLEVAVADDRAQGKDGLGAVWSPSISRLLYRDGQRSGDGTRPR